MTKPWDGQVFLPSPTHLSRSLGPGLANPGNLIEADASCHTKSGSLVETGKVVDGPLEDLEGVCCLQLLVDLFQVSDDGLDAGVVRSLAARLSALFLLLLHL